VKCLCDPRDNLATKIQTHVQKQPIQASNGASMYLPTRVGSLETSTQATHCLYSQMPIDVMMLTAHNIIGYLFDTKVT